MRSFVEVIQSTAGAGGSSDLVTLEALKLELGITTATEDQALEARITRYSNAIAEALGRTFALTEVLETFVFESWERFEPQQPLVLSHWPVAELYGVTTDAGALTADDYELDAQEGMLYRANSGWWGGRIAVSYLAGYLLPDEAPGALASAVIDAVRQGRSFSSADPTIRSIQHGDVSVGYYSAPQQGSHGLPASVMASIKQFRRISV